MERGLRMRGGRTSDEYWQRPAVDPAMLPDLSDPAYSIQRPNEFRMKKGGKVTMPKHTDEAMDRALIRKELSKAKSAGKMKSGGAVKSAKYARGGGVEIKGKTKGRMT